MISVKHVVVVLLFRLIFLLPFSVGIRNILGRDGFRSRFSEASDYRNGVECPDSVNKLTISSCDPYLVHLTMTLDSEYLRGSIATVHSILWHSSCPKHIFFHFVATEFDQATPRDLSELVRTTFPSLNFKIYIFREDVVINLISSSIRQALENPLNYAMNYLGDILDTCVDRVIYLDLDVVVVDDILKLWNTTLTNSRKTPKKNGQTLPKRRKAKDTEEKWANTIKTASFWTISLSRIRYSRST